MTATEIEYEGVTVPNVVGTPRETALRIVLAERVAVARELDEIRANAKVVLDRQRALVRLSQDIAAHASVPDDIVKPFFKGVGGKNPLDSSRKRHESLEAEETETAEVFATFCRKVSGNAPAEWGCSLYLSISAKLSSCHITL